MSHKTLGPFTGKQLTVIICTLMVLLLFPVGAWAVSGSNVFVADASSGARGRVDAKGGQNVGVHDPVSGKGATVDAKGNQNVGVHDPVSGKGATVDSSGALKVKGTDTVSGSVTANVAPPADWFNLSGAGPFLPATGDALIVTQLQLTWIGADPSSVPEIFAYVGTTDCNNLVGEPISIVLPDVQNFRTIDLRPGLAVPGENALCIAVANGDVTTVVANVIGYRVPSAQVPQPNAQAKPLSGLPAPQKLARLHH